MMRLCAACRKTSVRRTTGTAPDEMTSANTWPGPTEGSWSMSPTIKRADLSGTALMSDCISMTSTIEASSTTSRSQSSGLSSPRLKPPPLGSTSSSRWVVLASKPVASVMRFAARPVGAHSRMLVPFAARMRKMALTMVVFPTPGPPVMTRTLDISASRIAATWLSASARPICFSTHGKALSGLIQGQGSLRSRMRFPVILTDEGPTGIKLHAYIGLGTTKAMTYYLGKVFWLFAAPTTALILISASAGLFAVLANSQWASWLAAAAACGLVIAAFTPIGLALTVPLETRFPLPQPDLQVPADGIIMLPGGAGEGIAALSKLGQEYPNARLALCGVGPAGETLAKRLADAGVD